MSTTLNDLQNRLQGTYVAVDLEKPISHYSMQGNIVSSGEKIIVRNAFPINEYSNEVVVRVKFGRNFVDEYGNITGNLIVDHIPDHFDVRATYFNAILFGIIKSPLINIDCFNKKYDPGQIGKVFCVKGEKEEGYEVSILSRNAKLLCKNIDSLENLFELAHPQANISTMVTCFNQDNLDKLLDIAFNRYSIPLVMTPLRAL